MATLTIKPAAAGNDVQIKSGDGNTTHATFGDTATLGTATIADATITAGTLGSGIVFPAGHIIQTYNKQFVESMLTTSGSVLQFSSSNDLQIGTVEAGVTIIAMISGGMIRNRDSTVNGSSATVATALIGPTSDLTVYRGSGARTGGGSTVDMDMYGSAFVIGARYFSAQTASVVVRGGAYEYGSRAKIAWESAVDSPVTYFAYKVMGDQGITVAT